MLVAIRASKRRYATAICALGIVSGALCWWSTGGPVNADITSGGNSPPDAVEPFTPDISVAAQSAPSGQHSITLTATLISSESIRPLADQAHIGLGYFDPEDLEEYRRTGDTDSGRLADLAVIDHWLSAVLITNDPGHATLIAEDMPAADVYRVVAEGTDSGFYFGAHVNNGAALQADLGEIHPVQAAGLNVGLSAGASDAVLPNDQTIAYPVYFQRPHQDYSWTLMRRLLYPEIEQVLLDEQRLVLGQHLQLFPLAPGQVITVTAQGNAGRQVSADSPQLAPGGMTPLTLDVSSLLEQQALQIQLEATIIDEYGDALSGVRVLDHPDQNVRCSSDLLGRCRIDGVDAVRTSYFLLTLDSVEAAERGLPERFSVTFDPAQADLEQMAAHGSADVNWELPVYRRIVLDHSILPAIEGPPYPIFSLQRYDQAGWHTIPGEQFAPRTAKEMIIAVREDGTYRVQAAASALHVLRSEPVTVSGKGGEFFAGLQPRSARIVTMRITEQASGLAPERAMLMISSEFSEGPGNPLPVPASGVLDIPVTGVNRLSVEVLYPDGRSQVFEVDAGTGESVDLVIDSAVD